MHHLLEIIKELMTETGKVIVKGEYGASASTTYVFDGIDTTWNRVEGGKKIGALLKKVENEFDFKNPAASIAELVEAYKLIQHLEDKHWKQLKSSAIKEIIAGCAGLYLEAVADNSSTTPTVKNTLKIEAINRSSYNIILKSVRISPLDVTNNEAMKLLNNVSHRFSMDLEIPSNIAQTSPYWLVEKGSLGMYKVADKTLISLPETPRAIYANFILDFDGYSIPFTKEVVYKYNDPLYPIRTWVCLVALKGIVIR